MTIAEQIVERGNLPDVCFADVDFYADFGIIQIGTILRIKFLDGSILKIREVGSGYELEAESED